jgi:hypothetical protein
VLRCTTNGWNESYGHARGHNITVSEDAAQISTSNSLDEEFSVGCWCRVSQETVQYTMLPAGHAAVGLVRNEEDLRSHLVTAPSAKHQPKIGIWSLLAFTYPLAT